jgi:hypothetical protein
MFPLVCELPLLTFSSFFSAAVAWGEGTDSGVALVLVERLFRLSAFGQQ